jgi:hypothetical protein
LTETSGDPDSSDFIKAKTLAGQIGNPVLHEREEKFADQIEEGFFRFMEMIDNPLYAGASNSFHLDWKMRRNAQVRLIGVNGELLGGENLYLTRRKGYLLREAILPYKYHELKDDDNRGKLNLIKNVLYFREKAQLPRVFGNGCGQSYEERILDYWIPFLGECRTAEVFTERFRGAHLVFAAKNAYQGYVQDGFAELLPYTDFNLVRAISGIPPSLRELRKLELAILRTYSLAKDVPLDTTHLRVSSSYRLHKLLRVLRFIFNIGYARRVPIIQKGTALKTRIPAYCEPKRVDLRLRVNSYIRKSQLLDKDALERFLAGHVVVDKYKHFQATHKDWPNVFLLLKLVALEEKVRQAARPE